MTLLPRDDAFYVSHTGGAIGASSVLLIMPKPVKTEGALPQGVVVAILCNMQVMISEHKTLNTTAHCTTGCGSEPVSCGHSQVLRRAGCRETSEGPEDLPVLGGDLPVLGAISTSAWRKIYQC